MKRFASILTSLAVAGLVVSACDSPTAPDDSVTPPSFAAANAANTFKDNVKFPVTIGVFIPCAAGGAGEWVLLSGNMHSLSHTTVNGNNFRTKIHNQPQGITGTGLTTGDKYQGTGVTQETFGGSFVNGQFSDTFINNFRIIGQGRGNNYLIHQLFHVTFNANGELTAFVDNFSAECK
jgi:hypothetical protein